MKLPIVGPTYEMRGVSFDAQRCVNWMVIVSESGTSKEPSALVPTPGLLAFSDTQEGPVRAMLAMAKGDRSFAVSGDTLYEVFKDGTYESKGTLQTQASYVEMAENGTQVIIVDGFYGYIYNTKTDAFTRIIDPSFEGGVSVAYLDGYFVVVRPNSGVFQVSSLYDGLTWDALEIASAESSPDDILRVVAYEGRLYAFGSRSLEIFYNSGNLDFPFERLQGARKEAGTVAGPTVSKFDNGMIWLGVDEFGRGVVWKLQGGIPVRVSTQAIEKKIAESTDLTGSRGFVYHQEGRLCYVLQIQGLRTTLVYDVLTGLWHERMYWNNGEEQHPVHCHMFFKGMNLVGDFRNGKIYRYSLEHFTDDGQEVRRIRRTPTISSEDKEITHPSLIIDIEPGQGLTTGQGSDPLMMMRHSSDGGFTWSSEKTKSMGKRGKYKNRVKYNKLGDARNRVYEISVSDPVYAQINAAYFEPMVS